jgi:hypothetical protein
MSEISHELQTAIEKYLALRNETHEAGQAALKMIADSQSLPHDIQMMMLADVFLSYVFQNAACNYLIDLTVNFQGHFTAWQIGQALKNKVIGAVKLRGPEEWPETIGEVGGES